MLLCVQGLTAKYMKDPLTIDLVEGQSQKASTDVTHYMLQVLPFAFPSLDSTVCMMFVCVCVCVPRLQCPYHSRGKVIGDVVKV